MIRPFLRDTINHHKTQAEWKVHSGNEVIDNKTQGELKVHLIMVISFISSKDSDGIRIIRTKSRNTEMIMGNKQMKLLNNFLNLFWKISRRVRRKMRGSEIFLIMLIYCIIIFIKFK